MNKPIINKNECQEIASIMRDFSFEHPEAKKEFDDSEKELFYLFIAVGICHQINWNFLMAALKKIQENYPAKFSPDYMQRISDEEIYNWLSDYPKKWRLGKRFKRGELIRDMCQVLVQKYSGKVKDLLKASKHEMGGKTGLYAFLKDFKAYGEDSLCKKSAVFIDLIDSFSLWRFNDWQNYIPPIDYQIARIVLRNGVVQVEDKELLEKLKNNTAVTEQEDSTICSAVIKGLAEISKYSNKHTRDLQGFYWALGRECCDPDTPRCSACDCSDCSVLTYMNIECRGKCPLASVCRATDDKEFLKIKEQNFVTTLY